MKNKIMDKIKETFNNAKLMPTEELPSGYTKLGEFGNVIFAGKEMNNSAFPQGHQFVTWQRDYSGGMSLGHYFSNFENAQNDFMKRCELQTVQHPFNDEEYYYLDSAITHTLKSLDIEPEQKDVLQRLHSRILEQINPSIKRGVMFDESELFLIKAGLIKAGTFPDLDNATRKGIGQIVEKIETIEPEALNDYVYHDDVIQEDDCMDFERD